MPVGHCFILCWVFCGWDGGVGQYYQILLSGYTLLPIHTLTAQVRLYPPCPRQLCILFCTGTG